MAYQSKSAEKKRNGNRPASTKRERPTEALRKLAEMMENDNQGAISRFYAYHHLYERELNITAEKATVILGELARSDQPSPSNHSLWKMCSRSAKEIKIWKGNHDRFNDARHHAKMPYIPTHDSLYALKYLNPKQSTFPNRMIDLFSEIKLEWHILPNKDLSRWWADARLNDDEWRHNNLAKSLKARAPDFNVVEMLRLAQIVLENKLFPDPIKMYVTEPSESQSPSSVHSSSSNDEDFSNGKSRNYYHSSRNKHAVKRKHPWPSFSWNPDSGSDGDSSMNKVPSRRNKRPKTKSSAKGNRNDALLGSIHEALGAIHIALGAINNALSAIQGNKNNTVGSVDASDDGMSG